MCSVANTCISMYVCMCLWKLQFGIKFNSIDCQRSILLVWVGGWVGVHVYGCVVGLWVYLGNCVGGCTGSRIAK